MDILTELRHMKDIVKVRKRWGVMQFGILESQMQEAYPVLFESGKFLGGYF